MSISGDVVATPLPATRAAALVSDLVALTKPRIMQLVVVTGATTSVVAAGGWPGARPLTAVVLGGGLAAAGAGAMNCALEGDIDIRMPRTRNRAVAAGRVPAWVALTLGVVLNLVAVAMVVSLTNPLAAALTLSGTLWYVFVYTLWLKPRTTQNIVIGGLAGSFPPVAGWAAVEGTVSVSALALAAVIFLWTPPHFWALATLADEDYRAAGIPMMPSVAGARRTAEAMLVYALATVAVSVVPFIMGDLGVVYLAVALGTGAWLTQACQQHLRRLEAATARRTFMVSLGYLGALFAAAGVDGALL